MPSARQGETVSAAVEKVDPVKEHALKMRQSIEASKAEFARALPEHIGADRFMRSAFTALRTVKNLETCTVDSVMAGIMQAAQLGLEIADVRGQCYLIARYNSKLNRNEATFQLGYRGMIDMAARAGIIVTVSDVAEPDHFEFREGTDVVVDHRRALKDRGEPYAYYAIATFRDGHRPVVVVRGRQEIEKHRDRFASSKSKAGDIYGPWAEHFDAMARKTVIRALLNSLPTSMEWRDAEAAETRDDLGIVDHEPASTALGELAPADDGVIDAEVIEPDQGDQ